MKTIQILACTALLTAAQAASAQRPAPAYSVQAKDTTCQVLIYSPNEKAGLHLAYLTEKKEWKDVGQLCSSDYGQWGSQKRMQHPVIRRASDGTWRAAWSVNAESPCFAVAYSYDLVTWRPQDYPIVSAAGVEIRDIIEAKDGSFDIYLKNEKGDRKVHASKDFRNFEETGAASLPSGWTATREQVTVGDQIVDGDGFGISIHHLRDILTWFDGVDERARLTAEALPKNAAELAQLTGYQATGAISAKLNIDGTQTKPISDKLIGIFFEDISRAADGGVWAELVQNGDFEYTEADHGGWNATTAWTAEGNQALKISTDNALSENNKHHAVLSTTPIYNTGWDSLMVSKGTYTASLYARNISGKKKPLTFALVDKSGKAIAQASFKVEGTEWKEYKATLTVAADLASTRLALQPKGKGEVAVDMVSLMPTDTYKGHGLRRDLAEAIADLQPKFVRFPGGCMLHGEGLDNIYNWKESVGPLKDRKPAMNIWHYHQSRALGFYEYFQWCEDMGAEPLPVLAAGVPCQNSRLDSRKLGGQQGGIPMEQMPAYIQDVLDLIEWANGDPATSPWARLRADAGHPESFHLKMIGIGNEDLISTVFEERYVMICKAVKEKYPEIEVIGTVGPFHWPSSDYLEGWKLAAEHSDILDAVDEHYYEQPGWFIHNQNYYDSYDRSLPKVYLGEYASRGKNATDNALAEGIHLCNVERNGDVVEMASYAPLLSKNGHSNWSPDMIYFTNTELRLSESYKVQQLFGQHAGDTYISSTISIPESLKKYVGTSVVRDTKTGKTWLKVVNALPETLQLELTGLSGKTVTIGSRSAEVFEI